MNALFIDWACFGKADAVFTLEQMGYKLTMFSHKDFQQRISPEFDKSFDETVKGRKFAFCFSFNFYPVVAEICRPISQTPQSQEETKLYPIRPA